MTYHKRPEPTDWISMGRSENRRKVPRPQPVANREHRFFVVVTAAGG
jgi:hypothetical protein